MDLNPHILSGLERVSEVFKSLLWEKAKVHGVSPIQIQVLLFIEDHTLELCTVSHLAQEFQVTKPTISDAVRVLYQKKLVEKEPSPTDSRQYFLTLSADGKTLVESLKPFSAPIQEVLAQLPQDELTSFFGTLTQLIYQLNQKGIIQTQRTCFACRFYGGDRKQDHYCNLLKKPLKTESIRLDCPEFEAIE